MRRLVYYCSLLLGLLAFCPTASGSARGVPHFVSTTSLLPPSIQEMWFRYRTLQRQGELETAEQALRMLQQQATDLGIENLDALSATLVEDAKKGLEGGLVDPALDLTEKAQELSPNYPPAYFFRGWVLVRYRPWRIPEIIGEYLDGWRQAGQHIWLILYGFGNGLLWLMVSAGAAILVFILTVIIRYTPRLYHVFDELTQRKLNQKLLWFLMAVVLIGPLWFGLGIAWMVVGWLIIFWLFMTARERGLALLLVAWIASAILWLPLWAFVIKAKESQAFVVMAQAVRGEISSYPETAALAALGADEQDWRVSMARGLQQKRSEQYELARQQLEQAMKLNPDEVRILINLANVYFVSNRLDEAISWYKKALALNPNSVEAHYNLAQAYREKLLFDEGQMHYQEAEKLNADLIERYTRRALAALSHPVVDEPLTMAEVMRRAFASSDEVHSTANGIFSALWKGPLWIAPFIGFGFVSLVLLLSRLMDVKRLSFPCTLCGRMICPRCQKHIFHLRICENCLEANKKVSRFSELRQIQYRRNRQIAHARRISFLLPGIGHYFLRHTLKGFLFVFGYFTLLFIGLFRDMRFYAPYTWISTGGWLTIVGMMIGIVLLYITVFWDLSRIQLGWSEE